MPSEMRPLLLALAFVLAPATLAQPALPTGDWSGSIAWADADPVPLTANVEECVEGLKLRLRSADGAYRAEEVVHVEADEVHFGVANTRRNYTLACAAERQADGTYAGTCRTPGGALAVLRLQPPAQSTIGCSE
jgi:hypothetical protein